MLCIYFVVVPVICIVLFLCAQHKSHNCPGQWNVGIPKLCNIMRLKEVRKGEDWVVPVFFRASMVLFWMLISDQVLHSGSMYFNLFYFYKNFFFSQLVFNLRAHTICMYVISIIVWKWKRTYEQLKYILYLWLTNIFFIYLYIIRNWHIFIHKIMVL